MTLTMAPVEHLGFDETHPKTWRKGTTCTQCTAFVDSKRAEHAPVRVNFNINRLKADNAGGYTQHEIHRATVNRAKETGMEIAHKR